MATKKAPKAVSKPEVLLVLARLVRVLNRGGVAAGHLWSILTMLRGPDDDKLSLKRYTSARVRHEIGLRYGNLPSPGLGTWTPIAFGSLPGEMKLRNKAIAAASDHFRAHYSHACTALFELGIWDLQEERPVRRRK